MKTMDKSMNTTKISMIAAESSINNYENHWTINENHGQIHGTSGKIDEQSE